MRFKIQKYEINNLSQKTSFWVEFLRGSSETFIHDLYEWLKQYMMHDSQFEELCIAFIDYKEYSKLG